MGHMTAQTAGFIFTKNMRIFILVRHPKMSRFLIIILLIPALANTSFGQKPKVHKKKPVQTEKQKAKITFNVTDRLYSDSIIKAYSDSSAVIVHSPLNDTAFLKNLADTALSDVGESVSVDYEFQLPEKPLGWTSDYERIFTIEQIDTLNSIISKFESETTNEIAIVTINKSWTTPEKFDSLVVAIHNYWGVGKKEKNNGIVIGISAGLRRIRISNGYGIEAKFTDSETKKIIDDTVIPYFKASNYFQGAREGLLAIFQKLR